MNGGHSATRAFHPAAYDLPLRALPRAAAISTSGLLLFIALVLVARRLAGALVAPLPGAAPLGIAIVLVALALAIRRGIRSPTPSIALEAVPTVGLLLAGGALSLPGSWWPALFGMWALIGAEEFWTWYGARHWPARLSWLDRTGPMPRAQATMSDTGGLVVEDEPLDETEQGSEPISDDVTQQLTRSEAADGTESLHGWLRARFAPGQRTAYLHVAFCPPFARLPQLEYQQADGPSARIKVGQLLPYGVRLELKLSEPGPADILIELSAVLPSLAQSEPSAESTA